MLSRVCYLKGFQYSFFHCDIHPPAFSVSLSFPLCPFGFSATCAAAVFILSLFCSLSISLSIFSPLIIAFHPSGGKSVMKRFYDGCCRLQLSGWLSLPVINLHDWSSRLRVAVSPLAIMLSGKIGSDCFLLHHLGDNTNSQVCGPSWFCLDSFVMIPELMRCFVSHL